MSLFLTGPVLPPNRPQCWSVLLETLLQATVVFRGRQRSLCLQDRACGAQLSSFHKHSCHPRVWAPCWPCTPPGHLPREWAPCWPCAPPDSNHPSPQPWGSTTSNGSLSEHILVDVNLVLQYLFWPISVLSHSHSCSSNLSVCLTVEFHLCQDGLPCCEGPRAGCPDAADPHPLSTRAVTQGLCVSRCYPALPRTHTVDG